MKVKSNGKTMNWEIAGMWMYKVSKILESAKETFPHSCTVSIESTNESDGTPYGATAPHYFLRVIGPDDTDARFFKGIGDVLAAVTGS